MKKMKIIVSLVAIVSMLMSVAFIPCVSAEEEKNETAESPTLSIAYCNLSYNDTIYIKYAVKAENADKVKVLIWTEPQKEYVLGTQAMVLDQIFTENINGEDHMIFNYTKLAAKQMADVIYARAYTEKDGAVYYSDVNKYSILQYAYNKLGKTATASTDSELKELLTHMLAYGAAAQKYLGDYKVDRLATADWYQVKVTAGVLDDGCTHGLYLPGDKVTMTAPATDANGATFSYWADSKNNKVATTATYELTVGNKNEVYTPVYVKYSSGLEFDSNGDGTCYVIGMGDCSDTELVIPPVSPDNDSVIGIDSAAFAGEAITSVSFPSTLEEIGRRAFNNCTALTDVYYDGTGDEWNNNVSISAGNDAIENATKHFNESAVESFTVTFVDYDGTVLKTETVEIGNSATAPADPERENYIFTGWDNSFDNVTTDLTVTAQYERNITSPSIVVNDVIANVDDETVDVVISIANNPGISSLKFDVLYDDVLTLSNVTFDAAFGAYVTAPTPYCNPQTITCISPLAEVTVSGTFATLTFNISDTVTADTVANITITLHQDEVYDENFDPVVFEVINGTVNIQAN